MSILLTRVPERRFVALILPDPGLRTLRFLFRYDGHFRAMCWMKVGKDGSLYLNPRTGGMKPILHGEGISDGVGGWTQRKWREPDGSYVQNRKVSYHASGHVKGGTKMSRSVSVRHVERSTLIRQDDYAHPSRFAVIKPETMKTNDIIIPGQNGEPYELDEERPLTSRVFAAPLRAGNAQVPIIDDDPHARAGQTAIIVPATNLKNCQDLMYQIQFFNRPGVWPEMSTIAVLNADDPRNDNVRGAEQHGD